MLIQILIMVAVLVFSVDCSTVLEVGTCPNITTRSNLDLKQLSGEWYHIIHFPSEDEPFQACTRSSYTFTEDGFLEVVTKGRDSAGENIVRRGVLGKLEDSPTRALQLDIDGMPPLSVWVVHADSHVACLYSCTSFPGLRADWAWALTRSPKPRIKLVASCRARLRRFKVNTTKFVRIPQSDTACHINE